VCVGEIISLPWFSKELKNDLSKKNCLHGVILILLVRESIFVGWGSLFPIVLVPRYKLSLCHTPIKPDLLGFPGIGVFECGLRDHMITRFASRCKGTKEIYEEDSKTCSASVGCCCGGNTAPAAGWRWLTDFAALLVVREKSAAVVESI
jgi:hypothetical protein